MIIAITEHFQKYLWLSFPTAHSCPMSISISFLFFFSSLVLYVRDEERKRCVCVLSISYFNGKALKIPSHLKFLAASKMFKISLWK